MSIPAKSRILCDRECIICGTWFPVAARYPRQQVCSRKCRNERDERTRAARIAARGTANDTERIRLDEGGVQAL